MKPEASGFIEKNFLSGLKPHEYFLHAMSGREGVISTAIKTGETGYIQRKLIKTMEDLRVHYDYTVRNANGFIMQHVYGMDNFDGSKLEKQKFIQFKMNRDTFDQKYNWTQAELKEYLSSKAYNEFANDNNFDQQFLKEEVEQIWTDKITLHEKLFPDLDDYGTIYSPVNFQAVLNWVKYTCNLDKAKLAEVHPGKIIHKVRAFIKDINNDQWEKNRSFNTHFIILLRSHLSSKNLIRDYKINQEAFDLLLFRIKEIYYDGLVSPGEMVGIIAAQSIGQPLTQLTLNVFHSAGLGIRTKKTTSVPRLKEIFSTTTKIKTPWAASGLTSKTEKELGEISRNSTFQSLSGSSEK